MDMFDGVGRRRDQSTGQLLSLGSSSLNGYERNCLFRNNRDGSFIDVAYANKVDRIEDGRGLSVFDYDLDGSLDLVLRNYKQPAQLLHRRTASGHWLELKLVGTSSNRDAVGARVTLTAGENTQVREVRTGSAYLSASSLVQHFGLGSSETVDSLRIEWPSGQVTVLRGLAADRQLMLREGDSDAVVVDHWLYPAPRYAGKD